MMVRTFLTLSGWALISVCNLAATSFAQVPQQNLRIFSCSLKKYDWQSPSKEPFGDALTVAVLLDPAVPTSGATLGSVKGLPAVSPSKLRLNDPAHLLWPADSEATEIVYEGADQAIFSVLTKSATGPRAWLRIFDAPTAAEGAVLDADLILMREGVKPIAAAVSKMAGTCTMVTGADAETKFETLP